MRICSEAETVNDKTVKQLSGSDGSFLQFFIFKLRKCWITNQKICFDYSADSENANKYFYKPSVVY